MNDTNTDTITCKGVTNEMGFGLIIGFIDHFLYNHRNHNKLQ
jgi:hypothetical protein